MPPDPAAQARSSAAHLVAELLSLWSEPGSGWRDAPTAPAFRAQQASKTQGGQITAVAVHRLRDDGADARLAWFDGPKATIFNLLCFPQPRSTAPLCVADLVVLGGKLTTIALDMPTCGAGNATARASARMLESIRSQAREKGWPETNEGEVPAWYAQCRSGYDLFAKPACPVDLGLCSTWILDLAKAWDAWTDSTGAPAHLAQTRAHLIHAYKDHHSQHNPGTPMLRQLYGAAWQQRFFEECLYA